MTRGLLSVLLIFSVINSKSIAQIEIMQGFNLGKYKVGFKHEQVPDYSRAYGQGFRPVQMFIWYPSNEKSKTFLNYSDYYLLNIELVQNIELNKSNIEKLTDSLIRSELKNRKLSTDLNATLKRYKSLKTVAYKGTNIAQGNFPLIVFAPGGNTSGFINSVICEYLASHGFIVVSLPSLSNNKGEGWPFNQIGLNLQIDDMSFAINYMIRTFKEINKEKTCLISWSVGGVSQAIYSLKNQGIDMFISLDSGLGREYGVQMLRESVYFDYSKFNIPYLHFTGNQPEMYNVTRSSEFVDSIPSSIKYSLVIEDFAHQHFASQIGLVPAFVTEKKNKKLIKAYKNMCYLSLLFIDAYLNNKSSSKKKWEETIKIN